MRKRRSIRKRKEMRTGRKRKGREEDREAIRRKRKFARCFAGEELTS